jgi:hypothetical protein
MDTKAPFKKLWLLAILRAVRAAGIGPVSSTFIHRLVYFTTALAVVSREDPEVACVIKRDTGPYFPDYAWELERLVGMGLLTTRNQSTDIAELDTYTLYRITDEGIALLRNVAESAQSLSKTINHVAFCVRELAFAGVLQDSTSWTEDANQKSRTRGTGELIDYGELQASSKINFSAIEAAQLLGISTDMFTSHEDASEALRRARYWDPLESLEQFSGSLSSDLHGLNVSDLMSLHGPSLYARNLGLKRGAIGLPSGEESQKPKAKFFLPDVTWADQEVDEVLSS